MLLAMRCSTPNQTEQNKQGRNQRGTPWATVTPVFPLGFTIGLDTVTSYDVLFLHIISIMYICTALHIETIKFYTKLV